jgi:hypothetical protein
VADRVVWPNAASVTPLRRIRSPKPVTAERAHCSSSAHRGQRTDTAWAIAIARSGLEVVAAQFATRVGLAVDERPLRSQHLHRVTPVVRLAPPEVRSDSAVAPENTVGTRALLAGRDVGTERLRCRPDGIGQAAVGGPVAYWERFEDCVERRPVETWSRLRGIAALVDRLDIAEPTTVGQAPEPPTVLSLIP